MELKEVLKELEKMGSAQTRKVYLRHGAGPDLYGVSFANLYKLQKKIKTDHDLAQKLWVTSNTDAQSLAILIEDPVELTIKQAESWLKEINYYTLSNLLANLVARSSFAKEAMEKWMKSKKEYYLNCAYFILANLLKENPTNISDTDCKKYLKAIEKQIHQAPNRGKNAMNWAQISIGIYKPALSKLVLETAKGIGKVDVDHGKTACKTPDAVSYIQKALKRKAKK